jgi:pimeloyl-ACP methyl ester carboxylesterase
MGAEHRIRLADGRTLACLELGDPGGVPVLYFHGYPGSRLEVRLAAGAAERLGLRMLAPDRPGFGESSFQPGRTLSDWSGDIAQLMDHFDLEYCSVVGVSGGGPYALACAAHNPERLYRVALVCALAPLVGRWSTRGMLARNRLILALAAWSPPLARLIVSLAAYLIRRHPGRLLTHMMVNAPAADRRVLADADFQALIVASTAEALRQGNAGVSWELTLLARPWDFKLQDVLVPVRIWQGLADTIVPAAMARRLSDELPHSETRYLPDEGHLSLIVRHLDDVLTDLCR